jgi:hypothetical protein
MSTRAIHRRTLTLLLAALMCAISGCSLGSQKRGQHMGTTVMLVGLSGEETADGDETTLDCAKATIAWAAAEGSKLIMAPVGLPGDERWLTVDFALRTAAQQTNAVAARRWREEQSAVAERDLTAIRQAAPRQEALNMLAAATDGSRLLNYQHGPRTLVLCAAGQQRSPGTVLGAHVMSRSQIYAMLANLQPELEPMRLTRVVFGAAGDTALPDQSLGELAAQEVFWKTWAQHENALHVSYGPVPHFPY